MGEVNSFLAAAGVRGECINFKESSSFTLTAIRTERNKKTDQNAYNSVPFFLSKTELINCLTRGTSRFGLSHVLVFVCAEKSETRQQRGRRKRDWLLGMMMMMSRFDIAMTSTTKRSDKERSFNSEAEERDKSVA